MEKIVLIFINKNLNKNHKKKKTESENYEADFVVVKSEGPKN